MTVIFTIVYLVFVGFQYVLVERGMMPARPISNSFSLNEKSAFLARSNIQSCDVVASGSSMTLYNLSSEIISKAFPGSSYINISSWGITLGDNLKLLKIFIKNICKPKAVIILSSSSDFRGVDVLREGFSDDGFVDILKGDEPVEQFVSVKDIYYVLTHYKRAERVKSERVGQESLAFDINGGVSIMENDWSVKSSTWNINTLEKVRATNDGYKAFVKLVAHLNSLDIRVILVQTPIREDIYEQSVKVVKAHSKKMELYSSTQAFENYDLSYFPEITKQQYSDIFHLTGSGADMVTGRLVDRIIERQK